MSVKSGIILPRKPKNAKDSFNLWHFDSKEWRKWGEFKLKERTNNGNKKDKPRK